MLVLVRWLAVAIAASNAFAAIARPPLDLKQTLEEVRPALRSKLPKERLEALRKIAAVAKESPGAPSPDIARALAVGLDDENGAVRLDTLRLLVVHQDSEAVLEILLDEQKQAEREMKTSETEIRKAQKEAHSGPPVWPPPKDAPDYYRLMQSPYYLGLILESLGHIQDERAEKVLIATMERPVSKTPASVHVDACRALLELRSVRSMEAVIDGLASFDQALKKTKDEKPRSTGIAADAMVALFDPLTRADVDELYGLLANAATVAGAPGPAEEKGSLSERWKTWLETNRGLFRDKLGKTSGTLDVTLRERKDGVLPGTKK